MRQILPNTLDTSNLAAAAKQYELHLCDILLPGAKDNNDEEKLKKLKRFLNPHYTETNAIYSNQLSEDIKDINQLCLQSLPSYIDQYGVDNLINVATNMLNSNSKEGQTGFEVELNMGPIIKNLAEEIAENKGWKLTTVASTAGSNTNRYDYLVSFEERGKEIDARYEVKNTLKNFHVVGVNFGESGPIQYQILNELRNDIIAAVQKNVDIMQSDSRRGDYDIDIIVKIKDDDIIAWSNRLLQYKFNNNYPIFVDKRNIKLCSEILTDLKTQEETDFYIPDIGSTLDPWDNLAQERQKLLEEFTKKLPLGGLNLWYGKAKMHNK